MRLGIAARISSGISAPVRAASRPIFERLRMYVPFSIWRSVRRQYELYEPNFCWSVASR